MIEVDWLVLVDSSGFEEVVDCVICLKLLVEYVGQLQVCLQMEIFIQVVKLCGDVFDYLLIFGLSGLGKIILVNIVVNEMGVNLCIIFGLVLEKVGDFVVMFINFELYDVLFIDEIYCFLLVVEEVFYLVMEDYQLDIMIGEGFVVCFIKIDLLLFILIGVIICVGLLILLLCDCFGIVQCLEFYQIFDLQYIVSCSVCYMGLEMSDEGVLEVVCCLCGMLCIVNCLLCWVCDFVEVCYDGIIFVDIVVQVLDMFNVDVEGFDYMDCKLLLVVIDKFFGGLVGLDNFVVVIGEEWEIIEDVLEFYLIQQGFLQCMLWGRMVMVCVWNYFGIMLLEMLQCVVVEQFMVKFGQQCDWVFLFLVGGFFCYVENKQYCGVEYY